VRPLVATLRCLCIYTVCEKRHESPSDRTTIHTYAHTHLYKYTQIFMHALAHAVGAVMYTFKDWYTHTCVHLYTRTRTCPCTHLFWLSVR